jgi:hypothetical protein
MRIISEPMRSAIKQNTVNLVEEKKAINEKEHNHITCRIGTAAHRPICRRLLVHHRFIQHRPTAGSAFNGLGTDGQR